MRKRIYLIRIHKKICMVFDLFFQMLPLILIPPPLSKISPSQFKSLTFMVKMVDASFPSQDLGP